MDVKHACARKRLSGEKAYVISRLIESPNTSLTDRAFKKTTIENSFFAIYYLKSCGASSERASYKSLTVNPNGDVVMFCTDISHIVENKTRYYV